jgi:hypothetical protein
MEKIEKQVDFNFANEMPPSYEDNSDRKTCTRCKEDRPLSLYNSEGGYLKSICIPCMKYAARTVYSLRKTIEEPSDDYLCPICNRGYQEITEGKRSQGWVLDHCHEKETFRGWLCHKCNRAIGCFSDDIDRIERTLNYLKKHKNEKL